MASNILPLVKMKRCKPQGTEDLMYFWDQFILASESCADPNTHTEKNVQVVISDNECGITEQAGMDDFVRICPMEKSVCCNNACAESCPTKAETNLTGSSWRMYSILHKMASNMISLSAHFETWNGLVNSYIECQSNVANGTTV